MAKILKVKMGRTVYPGKVSRSYPPEYDSKKISVIAYEFIGDQAGIDARNDGYEYCIGIVSDADAPAFLASNDITEMAQGDAETQGALWRPQVNKILNPAAVMAVLEKVHNLTSLDATDRNVIDPDHSEPGIGKSGTFATLLSNTITKIG